MHHYLKRFIRLMLGLFLYGLGIVITMKAHLGYGPWEVFHAGIGLTANISIGRVSVLAGAVIVAIDVLCGEKLGAGTILNMICIGTFMDIILSWRIIPQAQGFIWQIIYLLTGLVMIAWATYFYISAGLGAGPRDCLMVTLSRRSGLSNGLCKILIEWNAVGIGFCLGGAIGIGTVITSFSGGFFVQYVFNLMKFDARNVAHESLKETLCHWLKILPAQKEQSSVKNCSKE